MHDNCLRAVAAQEKEEAPAGDAGMLLDLCKAAAIQIIVEVEGAQSNKEALQTLGQKARYVTQHLLEPGAKTIHEEKYTELLQILKAAQILVTTRGKNRGFFGSIYDAVMGRASKVKAEIDNVKEQLKDWVELNAPSRRMAPAPAPASAPTPAPPAPAGEHLVYPC